MPGLYNTDDPQPSSMYGGQGRPAGQALVSCQHEAVAARAHWTRAWAGRWLGASTSHGPRPFVWFFWRGTAQRASIVGRAANTWNSSSYIIFYIRTCLQLSYIAHNLDIYDVNSSTKTNFSKDNYARGLCT